jgi:hypothetical protein
MRPSSETVHSAQLFEPTPGVDEAFGIGVAHAAVETASMDNAVKNLFFIFLRSLMN